MALCHALSSTSDLGMRYYAACCQTDLPCPRTRTEIPERVSYLLGMIDRAVVGYEPFFDVRLVVFPEFVHAAPVYGTVAELADKLAVPIPNEHTDRYVRKARERNVFIQTGSFLEVDAKWPGHVFNTTCLVGPDGVLSRYRKVYPWEPWELHASPADLPDYDAPLFPVVETELGRLGVAICYDWLFPEAIRALALNGAEVLIRVSAYMDPWGATPPLDWWTLFNRAGHREHGVCGRVQPGRQRGTLPAVLVAGREHGGRFRRPHPGPGRSRSGREDRRRPDRSGRAPARAHAAPRPRHADPPPAGGAVL